MAETVTIQGQSYLKRNPLGVLGLAFITLGIYFLYWYYKANQEIQRYTGTRRSARPGRSSPCSRAASSIVPRVDRLLQHGEPRRADGAAARDLVADLRRHHGRHRARVLDRGRHLRAGAPEPRVGFRRGGWRSVGGSAASTASGSA